ncbi:body wall muscle protein HR-29-like [Bicyclus anynana]|uniref:Body wall muscle protein HR-29-like n=1 Tax=Bicyclus anynana TaxID=110368 RepID=A0ABM3LXJ0_BICAN|nr:body wall muscle protein HR-29-like [Bicyclus anynana]
MSQTQESQQNIPIQVTDALVFDNAFSAMKDRFAAHMKDIDEEMTKISKTLQGQLNRNSSGTTTTKEPVNLDFLSNSPLVEGEGENRTLRLQYDVSQFDASEITVTIQDNVLLVFATHEEATDNSTTVTEFRREFHFPQGVDPKTIVSQLSKDGVLVIEAPLPTTTAKQLLTK